MVPWLPPELMGPGSKYPTKFLFGHFPDRSWAMCEVYMCDWVLEPLKQDKRRPPQSHKNDSAALRALLEKIGETVQEDDSSNHTGYMERLIGYVAANRDSEKDNARLARETSKTKGVGVRSKAPEDYMTTAFSGHLVPCCLRCHCIDTLF